jgi:hypothetical protein
MSGLEGGREAGQALVDRVREEHSLAGGTARENVYVGLSLVGGTTTVNHVISGTSAVFSSRPPSTFALPQCYKLGEHFPPRRCASCRQTPPMLNPAFGSREEVSPCSLLETRSSLLRACKVKEISEPILF